VISSPDVKLSPRFLFDDQLTVAHDRGAIALRIWHKASLNRLEGHVPIVSDWHDRLCLVTVSESYIATKYLYVLFIFILNTSLKTTLLQLHAIIHYLLFYPF